MTAFKVIGKPTFLGVLMVWTLLAGCNNSAVNIPPLPEGVPTASRLVVPDQGIYTGAYIEAGRTEDQLTLEGIEGFEELVGKHQAIIASSSFWGENSFPTRNLEIIARHNALPLIYWSPWSRPYEEKRGPDNTRLDNILAGKWDAYIDRWADAAKAYNRTILVSWGLEMNGDWFPWSGIFYDRLPVHPDWPKTQHPGPEYYRRTYRYVVDRVRARGANRIQWVFHVNNATFPEVSWNQMAHYYPGPEYVDWLGLSAYGKQFHDATWLGFPQVMENAYNELCRLDPGKPVIVAEWGVGEFPDSGNKAQWITEAFNAFKTKYPRIKAAVFWHERWQNNDESYSNLRVNSSPEALTAFQTAMRDPFYLGFPVTIEVR
ncbi:MAG: glycosyl hydrolase [Desulfobacteraceae bacterium]|nr:glycosyl hydrolase [Desulfobacteraceae bacterium]